MRKIIVYTALTLDGYIAREDGSVDFLDDYEDEEYGYSAFVNQVDTAIMGYGTYHKMLEFPGNPFTIKESYVITRKITLPKDERVTFINGDLTSFVNEVRSIENKESIWMMGGGNLIRSFLKNDIRIDDWMLFVVPVLLGNGIALFPPSYPTLPLILNTTKTYKNGMAFMHYKHKT